MVSRTHEEAAELRTSIPHDNASPGLHPFPQGWYAVAFSQELKPGQVLTREFMGREIILWRQNSGDVHASDPFCPHLGNHLGVNGKVVDEQLECQFHGWRFDGTGACRFAPRGDPPPAIKPLPMYRVHEVCDVILVHHDPDGAEPRWWVEPPTDLNDGSWRRLLTRTFRVHGHVQDVGENSVDIAHLEFLHKFDLNILESTRYEGVRAYTKYAVARPIRRIPRIGRWLRASATFDIRATGFGFNIGEIEVRIPLYRCTARLMMLPTPVDETHIELRVSSSLRRASRKGLKKLLSPLMSLIELVAERVVLQVFMFDVSRDVRIWGRKTFLARPAIASHDGPIGKYRKWTRQFYPTGAEIAP